MFTFVFVNLGCQNGTVEMGKGRNHTGQNTNRSSTLEPNFEKDNILAVAVVREGSISVLHVFLISDDISCSFYDLVQ